MDYTTGRTILPPAPTAPLESIEDLSIRTEGTWHTDQDGLEQTFRKIMLSARSLVAEQQTNSAYIRGIRGRTTTRAEQYRAEHDKTPSPVNRRLG